MHEYTWVQGISTFKLDYGCYYTQYSCVCIYLHVYTPSPSTLINRLVFVQQQCQNFQPGCLQLLFFNHYIVEAEDIILNMGSIHAVLLKFSSMVYACAWCLTQNIIYYSKKRIIIYNTRREHQALIDTDPPHHQLMIVFMIILNYHQSECCTLMWCVTVLGSQDPITRRGIQFLIVPLLNQSFPNKQYTIWKYTEVHVWYLLKYIYIVKQQNLFTSRPHRQMDSSTALLSIRCFF